MGDLVALGVAVVVLVGVAFVLYNPKVQQSARYQATVVPLANIMDVGFIVMSPAIILIAGYAAPVFLLGICLLAIAVGFAIAYNIRHYEPLIGTDDSINKVGRISRLALVAATVTNLAYYTLLLTGLLLWPLGIYSDTNLAIGGTVILGGVIIIGLSGGLDKLNTLGNRTTAFNLSAVLAVVAAFVTYNIQEFFAGTLNFPPVEKTMEADDFRKIIGLFALVQGFESARYVGARFAAKERISTMRVAQIISSVVFVVFIASALILFVEVQTDFSQTAIFEVSEEEGEWLPWLILLAAIGSQTSAIVNATSSRSDMLVSFKVPRKATFLILLLPAIAIFLLADINQAVALASRVFAIYFALQALMALILARRAKNWRAVAGFAVIMLAMSIVAIFGLPT
jgi:hypothetical protein